MRAVTIGTRGSALARWQTDYVSRLLAQHRPEAAITIAVISTHGDQILDKPLPLVGGKGLFTAELEAALRGGSIDFAVHSLKDLPTDDPDGLIIGAVPGRANPADALVSRDGYTLETLPEGAAVGTGSPRRAAQLLAYRPDLRAINLRGNVDTRINKALDPNGPYDAVVLAHAGLARLGKTGVISQVIPFEVMLPAPGQGALGVQCRDEAASTQFLAPLNDLNTRIAVTAERAFLAGLGGGCSVPIAAYGRVENGQLTFTGRVLSVDGKEQVEVSGTTAAGDIESAGQFAADLARSALSRGAARLLESIE